LHLRLHNLDLSALDDWSVSSSETSTALTFTDTTDGGCFWKQDKKNSRYLPTMIITVTTTKTKPANAVPKIRPIRVVSQKLVEQQLSSSTVPESLLQYDFILRGLFIQAN